MPVGITSENLLHNIMETLSDGPKQKSVSFFEEETLNSVTSQFNRFFGRQKPVHHILGGGTSADLLLWRNKKISASVIGGATVVWVLFEWLNYHFLSLLCFAVVIGMLGQFVLSNASGLLNRSPTKVPRLVLPDDLFVNVAISIGAEVNRGLGFLQDVACGGNMKQFLVASCILITRYHLFLSFVLVVASLWAAAIIGSWCNFLTVLYIDFVTAHTLPVLYERYDDQIDSFVYNVLGQLQHNNRKLDAKVLGRIPTTKLKAE